MAVDWLKIKTEYINNAGTTYRSLAKKYRVSVRSIASHATAEQWVKLKEQHKNDTAIKIQQKTIEKISENESEIAAIKSRLKLKIYEQLEERMNSEHISASEFRKLVQSYKDMSDVKENEENEKGGNVQVIIDV